jgi:SSS family solute:Na+ symporter
MIALMTLYAPRYCSKEAAFYTILASIVVLAAWMLIPQVCVLPHVIYAEWIVCGGVFLGISAFARQHIVADECLLSKEKVGTTPLDH